ncbi:MAG: family 78 glycoside hydrolase catalytic domain [Phaeodactylibacter sp.]|nr:family 78 glycoside hydrolase catalytic domain [Phaeodactylibacter sp.]
MRIILTTILSICLLTTVLHSMSIYDLQCEHKTDPIGIDIPAPRLSWKLKQSNNGLMQKAYALQVATDPAFSLKSMVWETGKVTSGQSVLVPYSGPALASGERYFWRVKVWGNGGEISDWSSPAFWETGLLDAKDWTADWIEPVQKEEKDGPAYLLRKEFKLKGKIASARAYVSARGLYECFLNGQQVGDQVFTPGWTAYDDHIQYQVYDVTDLLVKGGNAVGIHLGDGWFRGAMGWMDNWGLYGKKLGAIVQIEVRYTNGSKETIQTDNSWMGTANGPVVMNSIYNGEVYDARKEQTGWSESGFNAQGWKPVSVADHTKSNLTGAVSVPVQKVETLKPQSIFRTPEGTLVADFGQNLVGWVRLKVKGEAGTTITIRHAEVLDKDGAFYTDNLRAAKATLTYTLRGGTIEEYEPSFTFMGFRYIEVEGFPGDLEPDNVTAVVIHSAMEPSGTFECSDTLINQLQHNIVWGQKGNFLDVPTDCPQRDERLGWTGDAQAFCRTAAFNMDVAAFFTKWLKDVAADQLENGAVPYVIPDVLRNKGGSAGWGDAATIIPWDLYQVYGDTGLLAAQYASMKAYVDYIRKEAGEDLIWNGGSVFGDWLFYKPHGNNHTSPDGYTDPDMIATMFFAHSAHLLAKAAAVLGKDEEADAYQKLYESVKTVFQQEFVTPSGRIASDSQTAYVLALQFRLLPEDLAVKATAHLVEDIRNRNDHLSTGFLGTPYLCHVLSEQGHTELGYDLLLQKTYPSWLYPVTMGATTIWERWDGQRPDSTFQDVGMNSFNHYAYGAIGDWMYRVVAGIEILEPGYKKIGIQPHPDARLQYAKATYESAYGKVASGWSLEDGTLILTVQVPPNTTAVIRLPDANLSAVEADGGPLLSHPDFENVRQVEGTVLLDAVPGSYEFRYEFR